jgi:signal transduction histidine kinase
VGARAALKDIYASSSDLLALLDVLRDLSKIEAGELALAFGGVAINEVVQQCVAVLQPQASHDRVIIRSSLATALPAVVADPASVRQLLLQLLSGSIKLAGAGGQVIVSSAVAESGDVVLRVRHKAIGTSNQQTASASEQVAQAAASPQEESGGLSLRLLLSKALAEANRASFRLECTREGTLVDLAFSPMMRIGPAGRHPPA